MDMEAAAAEARREYKRKWREKNREHIRAYNRQWRSKNREHIREYDRAYWAGKAAEDAAALGAAAAEAEKDGDNG